MDHVELSPATSETASALPHQPQPHQPQLDPQEEALLAALRPRRLELARQQQVPAFWVVTNATLRHLAVMRPATLQALLAVPGIGPNKAEKYGQALVLAVAEEAGKLGLELLQAPVPALTQRQGEPQGPRPPAQWRSQAREGFLAGATLLEVALLCDVKPSAALEELLAVVWQSQAPSLAPWVSEAQLEQVRLAGAALGWERLTPLHESLRGELPYPLLRLCRDFLVHAEGVDLPNGGAAC